MADREANASTAAAALPDPGICSCGKPGSWDFPVWIRTPHRAYAAPSCCETAKDEPGHHAGVKVPMKQWQEHEDSAPSPWIEEVKALVAEKLAAMTPQQRAQWDAREEAAARECEEAEQRFQAERRAQEDRRREMESDRKRGKLGNLTEIGRPYGLSGVAVGRILDSHSLRVVEHVKPDKDAATLTEDREAYREMERDGSFGADHAVLTDAQLEDFVNPPLRLYRAVREGFAVLDDNGKYLWFTAKVAPLLEPHAKGRK
jgi:hypothetical protein